MQRSPAHVMLLHTNALNAAALAEVVQSFLDRGWTFVAPKAAFSDPPYGLQPNVLPAGESIVWALGRLNGATDLRYPGEDSTYEEPILRALGLVQNDRGG